MNRIGAAAVLAKEEDAFVLVQHLLRSTPMWALLGSFARENEPRDDCALRNIRESLRIRIHRADLSTLHQFQHYRNLGTPDEAIVETTVYELALRPGTTGRSIDRARSRAIILGCFSTQEMSRLRPFDTNYCTFLKDLGYWPKPTLVAAA